MSQAILRLYFFVCRASYIFSFFSTFFPCSVGHGGKEIGLPRYATAGRGWGEVIYSRRCCFSSGGAAARPFGPHVAG